MGAVGYRDPPVRDRAPRATLRGRAVPERPGSQDPRPAALHLVRLAIGKRSVIGLRGAAGLPATPVSAEVPPGASERRAPAPAPPARMEEGGRAGSTPYPRSEGALGVWDQAAKKTCCKLLTTA